MYQIDKSNLMNSNVDVDPIFSATAFVISYFII